jgi:SpoVK/Ycf46/Vps4 family AAA+-type ATPase
VSQRADQAVLWPTTHGAPHVPQQFNFRTTVFGWVIPATAVLIAIRMPDSGIWILVAIASLAVAFGFPRLVRLFRVTDDIDARLAYHLGDLKSYTVFTRSLPFYRCVDVHRAIEALTAEEPGLEIVESQHWEALSVIVNGGFTMGANRKIKRPEHIARSTDRDEETFIPVDRFWVLPRASSQGRGRLIRARLDQYAHEITIELLASSADEAESLIARILKLASERSIFRHKILEVSFESGVRDSYGDVERKDWIDLIFKADAEVREQEIILEDDTRRVIERNIVDFHERREQLQAVGVPSRKGVLFYGPPGTGKTYTCKYLAHRLKSATTIVVAGRALHQMGSICNIARMLQPTILVLEDVDLVFAERETNPFGAGLGELMDQLDGFNADDQIIFILTTNAIERVERAIRDRPGRVSQVLYFGPPSAGLRRQYLDVLLSRYDTRELDLDRLVSATDGASQAFLKEFVYRAVQIATESLPAGNGQLSLANGPFDEALQEMRASGERAGERIIGFRTS